MAAGAMQAHHHWQGEAGQFCRTCTVQVVVLYCTGFASLSWPFFVLLNAVWTALLICLLRLPYRPYRLTSCLLVHQRQKLTVHPSTTASNIAAQGRGLVC